MAVDKKLLDDVKVSFNINAYESKVYISLISRGISSAGELSDISGVPRSRCYDVLESLEKKGFVFQKIGKPIKFIPIHPEQILDTLKKQTSIEENRMIALYESVQKESTFDELKKLYETGINYIDNSDISHSIQGRQNINLFLKDMIARAKNSCIIHTSNTGVKRKLKILNKSAKKSLKVEIHAPTSVKVKDKNIKFHTKDANIRFVHTDGKEYLFFTTNEAVHPSNESAVWISSKFASDTMMSFLK